MSDALVPKPSLLPEQPRQETAVDRLRRRYEKLQDRDLAVVEAMNRFSDLPHEAEDHDDETLKTLLASPDETIRAAGWKSRKELRIAAYGRLAKKFWPAAMQAAHERVIARERRREHAKANRVFNLNMITIPAPRKPGAEERVVIVQPPTHED